MRLFRQPGGGSFSRRPGNHLLFARHKKVQSTRPERKTRQRRNLFHLQQVGLHETQGQRRGPSGTRESVYGWKCLYRCREKAGVDRRGPDRPPSSILHHAQGIRRNEQAGHEYRTRPALPATASRKPPARAFAPPSTSQRPTAALTCSAACGMACLEAWE